MALAKALFPGYWLFVMLLFTGCGGETNNPAPRQEVIASNPADIGKTLILGSVSKTIREEVDEMLPLADYLSLHLRKYGYTSGDVKVTATLEEMVKLLANGEVDLILDSPFPIGVLMERADAQPLLRSWKKGHPVYHTVLFKNAENTQIKGLNDLLGLTVALDDPLSTSGFLLPMELFIQESLPINQIDINSGAKKSDAINYFFTGDDENTIAWIIRGKVDAGAIDNISYNNIPDRQRSKLEIIAETPSLPRQIVVHRKSLAPDVVNALSTILMEMDKSEDGRVVLSNVKGIAKFDAFPDDIESDFTLIKRLIEYTSFKEAS